MGPQWNADLCPSFRFWILQNSIIRFPTGPLSRTYSAGGPEGSCSFSFPVITLIMLHSPFRFSLCSLLECCLVTVFILFEWKGMAACLIQEASHLGWRQTLVQNPTPGFLPRPDCFKGTVRGVQWPVMFPDSPTVVPAYSLRGLRVVQEINSYSVTCEGFLFSQL